MSITRGSGATFSLFYRYFFDVKNLETYLASLGPYSVIVFIFLQALQVIVAPVPGEVTGFAGGYLFGTFWGTVYSTIGLTLGSMAAFYIARILGIKFVERIVKKEYIDKFNSFVTHKGLYVAFGLFLLPGFPKDSLCYLLGLTHMRAIDFLLINLIARVPGTVMLALQGSSVKNEHYKSFFIMLVSSIFLIIILYLVRERFLQRFTQSSLKFIRRLTKSK